MRRLLLACLLGACLLAPQTGSQILFDMPNVKVLRVGEVIVTSAIVTLSRQVAQSEYARGVVFHEGDNLTISVVIAAAGENDTSARVVPEHLPEFLSGVVQPWNTSVLTPLPRNLTGDENASGLSDPNATDRAQDVMHWSYLVTGASPVGDHAVVLSVEELRLQEGNWTVNQTALLSYTLRIGLPPNPFIRFLSENPLRAALIVVAIVGAAVYGVHAWRRPRMRPRSKTLQAAVGKREPPPPEEPRAEKELRILRAKRGDLEKSIENARVRVERGELTHTQLSDLEAKKRKQMAEIDEQIQALENPEGAAD